jgi:signal transduction histidine kinase
MTIKDIRREEDVPALLENVSNAKSGIKAAGSWKHRKKDGGEIEVEITSHPLFFDGRNAKLVLAKDITERRRAEQAMRETEAQLRQSQKLEGIGQLAGGIAHDFNNLLTVINGFSALAMKGLPAEDPLRDNLEEIKKAGDRAASLTRQLLAFSRKQVLQPEILNLDSVVAEMEKMLRRVIGENIDLRAVLEPELGNVKADPGQIEQIILNLVVNARDSMPGGGKVTIETDNVYLDEEYANNHVGARPGHYVMLAVSDTGTGMDEETQARIFEPFFTTKELGKGTGLGLSTIYGIVKQSGGNIWVYSEVGRGTTFKIYLPRVDAEAQQYKHISATEEALSGTETILLVEDEQMVLKLARQILATQGYRVLEAKNGEAALRMCAHDQGPIDLLLTDVIMPEMSGPELAERLHRLRPELRVLFMSGYTDDAIVHHGVLEEGANFIQKPFAPDVLARKVRQILKS